ncbi:MAG: hypothetical protein AB9856_20255 [Cellulosilyticaceae bacterium]
MSECICSSCKNLKSVMDEQDCDQNNITEVCEFGFPSEECSYCEADGCELTCDNYVEDCEEDNFIISKCSQCGKELKVASNNEEDGPVYCLDCYLSK